MKSSGFNFKGSLSRGIEETIQIINSSTSEINMIISVIGFGHIGSVIGSVIASDDNFVYGIDKNKDLLNSFINEQKPISEPGLQELVTYEVKKKNLY